MACLAHINVDCPVCGETVHIAIDGVMEPHDVSPGVLILTPVYDHDCPTPAEVAA